MGLLSLFLLIAVIVCVIKYMFHRPYKNFPPGPPRIPFVGSYIFLALINAKHLHKAAIWLGKFYKTNVIGLYLGSKPTVIALDQESVKSVLSEPAFDGRTDTFLSRLREPERQIRGIFFTEGEFWKDQRWFFLRHLRDFGFGRRYTELELGINDELQEFVEMIRSGPKYPHEKRFLKDGCILAPDIFFSYYAGTFMRIVTGKYIPREEREQLLDLGLQGMAFHKYSEVYGRLLNIIPAIRFILPGWTGYPTLYKANMAFAKFCQRFVDAELDEYESQDGEQPEKQNFIHLYAEQMHIAREKLIESPAYHREQLIMTLVDFLFASITTVPTQTTFLLQHLLLNPSCLARIHAELDEVVGRGRLPTLDDRVNLPYTEATLREILRLETIAPTAIGHRAVKDTTLCGYEVREGTNVNVTLYAFHRDKAFWGEDVDKFNPERFLDATGKLSLKLDKSLPFGHAGRLCAGETFARNTLFLMVTALLQNFDLSLPANGKIDLEKNVSGFIRYVPPMWVRMTPR